MHLHHVGQLVAAYDEALELHRDVLGMPVVGTQRVSAGVRLAVLDAGNCQMHLIGRDDCRGDPIDDLLDALLESSPYHLAYAVDDIVAAMDRVRAAGYDLLTDDPEDGLGPYRRAFVHPGAPSIPFEFVEPLGSAEE